MFSVNVRFSFTPIAITVLFACSGFFFLPIKNASALAVQASPREARSGLQQDARAAFQQGRFERVIQLLEAVPPGQEPPRELLRIGSQSYARIGRPDEAFKTYVRLIPPGRPDDAQLLRELAFAFITSRVRDSEEHIRIAAYTALGQIASPEMIPLFEDGLLDSSVLVRSRAVEGLGRTLVASHQAKRKQAVASASIRQALHDPAPSVRIAALNAIGDIGDRETLPLLNRIAHTEEGAVHVFALAAQVKLGQPAALDDILSAATLPDPDTRMAALGVLGRLKHPASFSLLSQSVYDPDPSVRAFAAGALGEFGDPKGGASLVHAIGDEHPRVRSIAAVSLGRLKLGYTRPILWQAAKDPVALVRAGAVEGLLRLGDDEAILVATELAKHPDPSVRGATAQALGLARNQRGLPLLDLLRQDLQPQPRLTAVLALGKIRSPESIRLLKQSLQDSDPAVRIAAAGSLIEALSRIKS